MLRVKYCKNSWRCYFATAVRKYGHESQIIEDTGKPSVSVQKINMSIFVRIPRHLSASPSLKLEEALGH